MNEEEKPKIASFGFWIRFLFGGIIGAFGSWAM
jgi:hypothetical protein